MHVVDGAAGEGGGQILRTAVGLSVLTGAPVRVTSIRARRKRPGLQRQHLVAVQAAAALGRAEVTGAELGSTELTFVPTARAAGGDHVFRIGSAGSTTLVLQTVLPALLAADAPSSVELEGGTHNPLAPTVRFLARAFLPLLARMGGHVELELVRPGFYPAGGGLLRCRVRPAKLAPLELVERGPIRRLEAVALVAHLPATIGERECRAAREALSGHELACRVERSDASLGPGNVISIEAEAEHVTEVFTGFGERGRRAEDVAARAAAEAKAWLDAGVPVGEHLADQLLVPLCLAGGGTFRTVPPTDHTRTQAALLEQLLGRRITLADEGGPWRVTVA